MSYCVKLLKIKIVAKEFFESHLPDHIKSELCYETHKIEKKALYSKILKFYIRCFYFLLNLRKKMGMCYLLLEHQSTPAHFIAFRLYRYMFNVLDRYIIKNPKTKKLPFIYPLSVLQRSKKI